MNLDIALMLLLRILLFPILFFSAVIYANIFLDKETKEKIKKSERKNINE